MTIATPMSLGLSWPLTKKTPNLGVASHRHLLPYFSHLFHRCVQTLLPVVVARIRSVPGVAATAAVAAAWLYGPGGEGLKGNW